MSIVLQSTGGGQITLLEPTTASNFTQTLPAATGTVALTNAPVFTGQATIPTINLTGGQITFPATQSASTDANTLDDYEEGTWTPSVGGTATYGAGNNGRYTKIGNVVTIVFRISIATIGTGASSVLSGLPFASASIGSQSGSVSYYDDIAISTIFVSLYIENNATTLQFVSKASAGTAVDNGPLIMGNSTDIFGTATYRTA